jgi:outer membrane protein assembly factor BamA
MRLLAVVLALAVQCLAQTPAKPRPSVKPPASPSAPAVDSWPLLSLKVTGNRLYTEQQVVAASGLETGQAASKAKFDAGRARLFDTGAFESVGYQFGPTPDGKGYAGTFEVVEVQQLYPFRFDGLPAPDPQLRAFLAKKEPLFGDKIPGAKAVIDRFASELQGFLADRFKDQVRAEVVADKPGELAVLFRPATGPPAVAEVEFTGSQALPASTLQNALSAVSIGIPYREATIRQLLDTAIRPVYAGRGRLQVSFPKVESEKAKNVDGVRVKIQVDEGPVYNFGAIRSTVPILTQKQVLKMPTFKTGDVANFDMVNTVIDSIQRELRHEGYMRSTTQVERVLHDKEKTVDITFTSALGTQFLMGKLTIQGLDVVSEPAIRKLWSMKPGNPYNADYPQMFLDRVKQDGYFDYLLGTRWDQAINEKTHTIDVTLYFKGGIDPDEEKKKQKEREQQQGPPEVGGSWPNEVHSGW